MQVGNNIELSLEGSNLLDTTSVNQQQLFGDSVLTPGAAPVRLDPPGSAAIGAFSWECG